MEDTLRFQREVSGNEDVIVFPSKFMPHPQEGLHGIVSLVYQDFSLPKSRCYLPMTPKPTFSNQTSLLISRSEYPFGYATTSTWISQKHLKLNRPTAKVPNLALHSSFRGHHQKLTFSLLLTLTINASPSPTSFTSPVAF